MDHILHRIYEIEEAAEAIRTGAEEQKKLRAEQMKQRTADFDERLAAETARRIDVLRGEVTARNEEALRAQRDRTEQVISSMQAVFDGTHERVARELFEELLRPAESRP